VCLVVYKLCVTDESLAQDSCEQVAERTDDGDNYPSHAALPAAPEAVQCENTGDDDDSTGPRGNLNMDSAFVHLLADTLRSVTVLVSAVMVWGFGTDPMQVGSASHRINSFSACLFDRIDWRWPCVYTLYLALALIHSPLLCLPAHSQMLPAPLL
jgi:hypothetical protein